MAKANLTRKRHRSELQTERAERRVKNSPVVPPNKPVAHLPQPASVMGREFLESYAWRRLRMIVLKRFGTKCMCCGATPESGASNWDMTDWRPKKYRFKLPS